jgi:hypothetical protein
LAVVVGLLAAIDSRAFLGTIPVLLWNGYDYGSKGQGSSRYDPG